MINKRWRNLISYTQVFGTNNMLTSQTGIYSILRRSATVTFLNL